MPSPFGVVALVYTARGPEVPLSVATASRQPVEALVEAAHPRAPVGRGCEHVGERDGEANQNPDRRTDDEPQERRVYRVSVSSDVTREAAERKAQSQDAE